MQLDDRPSISIATARELFVKWVIGSSRFWGLLRSIASADKVGVVSDPPRYGVIESAIWIAAILLGSATIFLMYFPPMHLHDPAHYASAGVSMIRDHQDILWPYGFGPNYELLQNKTIVFNTRTDYPSKLYSLIFGLIYAFRGDVKLEYIQWIAAFSYLSANVLLYLVGRIYLQGVGLGLFLVSTIALPMMIAAIYPGTDGFAYALLLFLLWLVLGWHIRPSLLGLIAGVLSHSRAQMLSIVLVFPFFYSTMERKRFVARVGLPLAAGFIMTYAVVGLLFSILVHNRSGGSAIGFYVDEFRNTTYSLHEISTVLAKTLKNYVALFDSTNLFVYAVVPPVLMLRGAQEQASRRLTIAAVIFIAVPFIMYNLHRLADPSFRYYLFAVPLLSLAAFLAFEEARAVRFSKVLPWILSLTVLSAWYVAHGFPVTFLKAESIISRAKYLDFDGVQEALAANFTEDDVVIINHSLPTALARLKKVVYVPSFRLFRQGDNSGVQGIIFVFGDDPPNDFFKPKDWFKNGVLPELLTDERGVVFKRVYAGLSVVAQPDGAKLWPAHFYIYKNIRVPNDSPGG